MGRVTEARVRERERKNKCYHSWSNNNLLRRASYVFCSFSFSQRNGPLFSLCKACVTHKKPNEATKHSNSTYLHNPNEFVLLMPSHCHFSVRSLGNVANAFGESKTAVCVFVYVLVLSCTFNRMCFVLSNRNITSLPELSPVPVTHS